MYLDLYFVIGTFRGRGSDSHFPVVPLDLIQQSVAGGNGERQLCRSRCKRWKISFSSSDAMFCRSAVTLEMHKA